MDASHDQPMSGQLGSTAMSTGPHQNGGRGNQSYRRRSPGGFDRRPRQRNRSRSPVSIDRYVPSNRGGYDEVPRDGRRRGPSPPPANIDRYIPGQEPRPIMGNPVPDPHRLEYQVGFSYFGEWWRHNEQIKEEKERQKAGNRRPSDRLKGERESRDDRAKEKAKIQVAYDTYKEEMQVKMAKTFVLQHKNEEWFKECYVPAIRDEFRGRVRDFRQGNYHVWERDLDAGLFDAFTLEGIYKGDSNGVGGIVEKEEGETVATAEVLGVGDLLPSKGGEIRDESAFQPALLIKTMAPTVSRIKIEDFCKEHLGEANGGFKWLSLSDPNPSKRFHRIGWVMLNPGSAEAETSHDRGDGREEENETETGDLGEGQTDEATNPPSTVAGRALEAIDGKTIHDEGRGDFTCHVGIHVPPTEPRKKALWDLFSAPERIERDVVLATRLVSKFDTEANPDFCGAYKIDERIDELRSRGVFQPPVRAMTLAKKARKVVDGPDRDMKKEAEDGEEEGTVAVAEGDDDDDDEEEEGACDEEEDDESLLMKKKTLDLLVEYLRRVYHFCFFCVFESDSVHELARKCPGGHLRRPRATLNLAAKAAAVASAAGEPFPTKKRDKEAKEEGEEENSPPQQKFHRGGSKNDQQLQRAFNWVKTFEDKILQILEPENVDLRKLGGMPVEEALAEELPKFVKQEDENKFRCKVPDCTKLFKGKEFWQKHVEKRHTEWVENLKLDLDLVNHYVLDPAHIAPSRSDANSNGHFPSSNNNNHQFPAGTPRGFNLGHIPMPFNPGMPGGAMYPTPTGYPAAFGSHPVTMPPHWTGPLMGGDYGVPGGIGGPGDRHQSGPMRRGGRFGGHSRAGPYDRRPRDGQDPRWNAGSGELNGSGGPGAVCPPGGYGGLRSPPRMGAGMGTGVSSGGRPGGTGYWGDGAGEAGSGPRDSIQGRSLKSYEDLDAVGGGAGGELNY